MFNLTWMEISIKKIFDEVLLIFPSYKRKEMGRVRCIGEEQRKSGQYKRVCAPVHFGTTINSFSQSTFFVQQCSRSSNQKLFHSVIFMLLLAK